MSVIIILGTNILWQIGGQICKAARRYGIPSLAILIGLWETFKAHDSKKEKLRVLFFLLLIAVLSMGYGVNSVIRKLFDKEWAVRLVYALLLSLPFLALTIYSDYMLWWEFWVGTALLIGAFQVRAGLLFHVGTKDVLIEDIFRATATSINILFAL